MLSFIKIEPYYCTGKSFNYFALSTVVVRESAPCLSTRLQLAAPGAPDPKVGGEGAMKCCYCTSLPEKVVVCMRLSPELMTSNLIDDNITKII